MFDINACSGKRPFRVKILYYAVDDCYYGVVISRALDSKILLKNKYSAKISGNPNGH